MEEKKKYILIVEDSLELQELSQEILEHQGYRISCAGNGQEALKLLRATDEKPNLILLDLMMPVMDGYEFLKQQKADPNIADIPVVVITADGRAYEKAEKLGAADYLYKTTGIEKFIEIVKKNC